MRTGGSRRRGGAQLPKPRSAVFGGGDVEAVAAANAANYKE
ncbi:hypothetical protein GCM10007285_28200 [Stappia taiwanensis]|nr:hypothetical protein GCM10007285_28200 [Stappia taiwanensis]